MQFTNLPWYFILYHSKQLSSMICSISAMRNVFRKTAILIIFGILVIAIPVEILGILHNQKVFETEAETKIIEANAQAEVARIQADVLVRLIVYVSFSIVRFVSCHAAPSRGCSRRTMPADCSSHRTCQRISATALCGRRRWRV